MRLSIIIPMYNEERWIGRCIESILDQTFHDFEAIIIDDGSTDHSLEIVKRYCGKDQRIRCVSTKNQGSAGARNVGLKYSSGDMVAFADADDEMESSMYETMVSVLDDVHADIVECTCRRINKYGREIDHINFMDEEINGSRKCIAHFMKQKNTKNYMCNKVYRKSLFEGVWFPHLRFSEDYYMNAVLHSKIDKKVILSAALYRYRIYPGQSTDNRRIDVERTDGIRAGNMAAELFFGDKELETYAGLYACKYALFIADFMNDSGNDMAKRIRKHMRPELCKALSHISFHRIQDEKEKKVLRQCLLLLVSQRMFVDYRWLLV